MGLFVVRAIILLPDWSLLNLLGLITRRKFKLSFFLWRNYAIFINAFKNVLEANFEFEFMICFLECLIGLNL